MYGSDSIIELNIFIRPPLIAGIDVVILDVVVALARGGSTFPIGHHLVERDHLGAYVTTSSYHHDLADFFAPFQTTKYRKAHGEPKMSLLCLVGTSW